MLINRAGEVKISDFGIVRKMGDDDDDNDGPCLENISKGFRNT
jgi:hypothetical protein